MPTYKIEPENSVSRITAYWVVETDEFGTRNMCSCFHYQDAVIIVAALEWRRDTQDARLAHAAKVLEAND